ncbi:ABC transporter substrate-binding protein [Nocardioides euryhalodurans]|uniref:ABC transporter substrate-binding protein n=1 Tax=Nocardioides euryhalodurans TaxID=2518370 RepID=A0A4V1BEA8_9ACTN|nr:ABC transporter substrate-binding protein [Nocardioides euryhalodurans]QBR93972.1 ABC transporter substrate-binding protein [Nocardioides euryhalodurans]
MPALGSPRRDRRLLAPLLLVLGLVLSGCGGVDTVDERASSSSPAADPEFPVSVLSGPVGGDTEVTLDAEPTSIVSLSPTATEMLWAVGAGDQVVAVDDQSDYPEDVPVTKLSGYQPNVEAILEYEPDLVIASDDTGDLVSGLDKARVPTLVLPAAADLEETYSQLERVGQATGHVEEAAELVDETRSGIEQAVADAPELEGVSYFHELSPDLYSATSATFIGSVYGLFGLENIADEAKGGDDYPQLASEYVVGADPDLVFLADGFCCGVTAEDVAKRPGWQQVPAVVDEQVHVIDEDIASRWGPRTLDFVQQVSEILQERETALDGAGG